MVYALRAPGRYVQGAGEMKKAGKHAKKLGKTFFVICSAGGEARYQALLSESFEAEGGTAVFSVFGGEASPEVLERITAAYAAADCDAVVGLGGGKALDTAKAVAEGLGGVPCIIIPTVASNDAPCSGVSVLYNEEGMVVKAVMMRRNPDLVLVDTTEIAKAPRRLFAAGLGDALATYFEARACHKSGATTMARGNVSNTALMMAKLCYDLLLRDGREALRAVEQQEVSLALHDVVEASIYLSGLGFENGGLAVAHAVNDGLGGLPALHACYHGEKVAFGTLVQLILEAGDKAELDTVLGFLYDSGLPLCFADLGLTDASEASLRRVAKVAAHPKESSKNLRADITEDEIYAALLEADRVGRHYRAGREG